MDKKQILLKNSKKKKIMFGNTLKVLALSVILAFKINKEMKI